jgi:hypothetical protein
MKARLNDLKSITSSSRIYFAASVGKGWAVSRMGSEKEHVQSLVDSIQPLLVARRPEAHLLIPDKLQRHIFERFLVEAKKIALVEAKITADDPNKIQAPIDPINITTILTDDEVIQAFSALESDPILNQIRDDEEIDESIAADLLAKVFEPAAKAEGLRYAKEVTPTWMQLNSKDVSTSQPLKVDVLFWEDILNEFSLEPSIQHELKKLEEEYEKNVDFAKVIDSSIKGIMNKKQIALVEEKSKETLFDLAGKRLKTIFNDPKYSDTFKNKKLLKFRDALQKLDLNSIGVISSRKYFLEELAQMICVSRDNGITYYPGTPPQSFKKELIKRGIKFNQVRFERLKNQNQKKPKEQTTIVIPNTEAKKQKTTAIPSSTEAQQNTIVSSILSSPDITQWPIKRASSSPFSFFSPTNQKQSSFSEEEIKKENKHSLSSIKIPAKKRLLDTPLAFSEALKTKVRKMLINSLSYVESLESIEESLKSNLRKMLINSLVYIESLESTDKALKTRLRKMLLNSLVYVESLESTDEALKSSLRKMLINSLVYVESLEPTDSASNKLFKTKSQTQDSYAPTENSPMRLAVC